MNEPEERDIVVSLSIMPEPYADLWVLTIEWANNPTEYRRGCTEAEVRRMADRWRADQGFKVAKP